MRRIPSLWEHERLSMEHALDLTLASLQAYGGRARHWAVAYSGGKDSRQAVTIVSHLLATGQLAPPESLTVLYADTHMELPPLHACALTILSELGQQGIATQIVLPALDDRFLVYLFGRGVPAPKNRFRWCTPQFKVEPMERALVRLREQVGEKLLMFTGVRLGESAARDTRIALSCSLDGAECGQGWLKSATPSSVADVLAPLLHWRVCHVWDWLFFHAPEYGFSTQLVAESYGGEEAEEVNARTGCIGCNLASRDVALDTILTLPQWAYLSPLKRLKPLYRELRRPVYRLRKQGERTQDGRLGKNPMRLGPYTMQARERGLAAVLAMQEEINQGARQTERPLIDLINAEEQVRVRELQAANTWPDGWSGCEARGDALLDLVLAEGVLQRFLTDIEQEEEDA